MGATDGEQVGDLDGRLVVGRKLGATEGTSVGFKVAPTSVGADVTGAAVGRNEGD